MLIWIREILEFAGLSLSSEDEDFEDWRLANKARPKSKVD
jgi:hypothetical protein